MKKLFFLCLYLCIHFNLYADQKVNEVWYDLIMMDKSIGYAHESTFRNKDGFITKTKQELSVRRGPVTLHLEEISTIYEDQSGNVYYFERVENQGAIKRKVQGTLLDGYYHIKTIENDVQTERKVEWKNMGLGPHKSKELLKENIENQTKDYQYNMFFAMSNELVTPVRVIIGDKANITVHDKTIPAYRIFADYTKVGKLKNELYVDPQGQLLKSQFKIGPITLKTVITDRSIQDRELEQVAEIMASTIIKVEKIPNARSLKKATWDIQFVDLDSVPKKFEDSSVQSSQKISKGHFQVLIDLNNPQKQQITEQERTFYLSNSSYINIEDVQLQKLAKSVSQDEDKTIVAERLRQLVYNYIQKKSLSMGFASASQTVRNKEGDCTEHSVLLAALLRISDIPSRVAVGLVYADQFIGEQSLMGYHMWTQGYLEGKWVDLDPSINASVPFDATHILFATSALQSESGMELQSKIFEYLNSMEVKRIR